MFDFLQSSSESLAKENSAVNLDLIKAKKDNNDTLEKLKEVEEKNLQLQQNFRRCGLVGTLIG